MKPRPTEEAIRAMNPIDYTGLLYAEPSIWEGFARLLDIDGNFDDFNYSDSESEADLIALGSDWYAVGADLLRAIDQYKTLVIRVKDSNG